MDSIIGLGRAGCSIATEFAQLPHHKIIFRIDSEDQENLHPNCIDIFIPHQNKPEDYETKTGSLKKHFKKLKGDVLFIVAGGGSISMASLVVLESIKGKCNITVLYIRPDVEFLGAEAKLKEKVTYNVFQEYARSGLFKRLYILSNILIERAMGGVSIISYYEKINQTIVSTFDMMDRLQKLKPVASTFSELPIGTRISTFGLVDIDSNQEKMFFDLDTTTDSVYYFAYNESVLKEDVKLLNRVKSMIKNKMESGVARVSYGIFATNYNTTFVVCANHTSMIQSKN